MSRSFLKWKETCVGLSMAGVMSVACAHVTTPGDDRASNLENLPQYLRVVEDKGKSIALEMASHNFVREDGSGPRIGLIGVAHIADKSFYDVVESLLQKYDIVLYESVKPPGTGGAGGETDEERITSTKAALEFVGGLIETHYAQLQSYPPNTKSLEEFVAQKDARMSQFLRAAMVDAWGKPLVYQHIEVQTAVDEKQERTTSYALFSLGADGKIGGEGINGDIQLSDQKTPVALALSQDDGLQSQLASALGLEFQLDSLPYDSENWRCSDMAMDEVNRRLAAKGLDFGVLGGTLAGSSMPAKLIKLFLGFIKMADGFMEGMITDTLKIVMIEVLGDPVLVEQGLTQLGDGFGEVIIVDRNQVVIDDLKEMIAREPQIKSIGVLYGAGHMPDLAKQMHEQLGYQRTADETHWVAAIKVDLTESKVPAAEIQRMRAMMKQAMRQQMRRR